MNKTEQDRLYSQELQKEYSMRFGDQKLYRDRVWITLIECFFQNFVKSDSTVLDLGSGWGEFINNIQARKKYAMDLNPDGKKYLKDDILFLKQNCSHDWGLELNSLDVVFTSNFFEHLLTKNDLAETITQTFQHLKPGGKLICLSPNIKFLPGEYWDFWDHHVALTEESLAELLKLKGFSIELKLKRFLPYTMSGKREMPMIFVKMYLKFPLFWKLLGKQFLIVATKL